MHLLQSGETVFKVWEEMDESVGGGGGLVAYMRIVSGDVMWPGERNFYVGEIVRFFKILI